MYDEKTRKYDAYIDTLQYKYVEGIEKGIEQGRTEERENSIARFIKYVKLGVISKKRCMPRFRYDRKRTW